MELSRDPGSTFGGLLARCIRDNYVRDEKWVLSEGVVFLILGAFSSVATTYLLSMAGVFV